MILVSSSGFPSRRAAASETYLWLVPLEAVAADAVRGGELPVDRVRVRLGRQRLVERGVEDGHVRHVGEGGLRGLDPLQRSWVVQRRERGEVVDVGLHPVGDDGRLDEHVAAVHDAVADRDGRALLERRAVLGERVEHRLEARGVVGDGQLALPGVAAGPVPGGSGRLADALHEPGREHGLRAHLDELVLEGRRSGVDDEDDGHGRAPDGGSGRGGWTGRTGA
ncbi:hypothetical protein ABID70_000140 [Clavibacter michiganensis]